MAGTFTYAWARPSIPDAHVLAKTLLGTMEVGYPFVRSERATIRGSVGMDIVNQDVDLSQIAQTRDRLRVLFLGSVSTPSRPISVPNTPRPSRHGT